MPYLQMYILASGACFTSQTHAQLVLIKLIPKKQPAVLALWWQRQKRNAVARNTQKLSAGLACAGLLHQPSRCFCALYAAQAEETYGLVDV